MAIVGTRPGLQLLEELDGRLYVMGPWPPELWLGARFVDRWRRPGSRELVDIRCANGRGVYRVGRWDALRGRFPATLVYTEMEGLQ